MSLTDARRQRRKRRRSAKSLRKMVWNELNRPGSGKVGSWWIPKIPSVVQMVWRQGMLTVLTIGVLALEIIAIYGQNTLWTFAFVNRLMTNVGTNQFDIAIFVLNMTWFLISGIGGIVWTLGYWDRWMGSN